MRENIANFTPLPRYRKFERYLIINTFYAVISKLLIIRESRSSLYNIFATYFAKILFGGVFL